MDVTIRLTCCILLIDCLLIALDAHMFSHNGYGPRLRAPKLLGRDLGDRSFWALGPGPGPIPIMAEHMGIKGNR